MKMKGKETASGCFREGGGVEKFWDWRYSRVTVIVDICHREVSTSLDGLEMPVAQLLPL